MYMHYVSFPGLGIESFGLKQSAFTLLRGHHVVRHTDYRRNDPCLFLRTHKSKD